MKLRAAAYGMDAWLNAPALAMYLKYNMTSYAGEPRMMLDEGRLTRREPV